MHSYFITPKISNLNGKTRWMSGEYSSKHDYYIKYKSEYDKSSYYKNKFEESHLDIDEFYENCIVDIKKEI